MKGFIALFGLAAIVFSVMSFQVDAERVSSLRELVRANTKMQALSLSSNFKMAFVALQALSQNYNPREKSLEARGKELLQKQSSFAAFQIQQFDIGRAEYVTGFSQGEMDSTELARLVQEARDKGISIQAASTTNTYIYFAIRYGEIEDPQHFLSVAKINAAELTLQLDAPSSAWQQASVLVNKEGQRVLVGVLDPPASIWKVAVGAKNTDGVSDIKSDRGETWTIAHADLGIAGLKVVTLLPLSIVASAYREKLIGLSGTVICSILVYGLMFQIWRKRQRALLTASTNTLIPPSSADGDSGSNGQDPPKEAQG